MKSNPLRTALEWVLIMSLLLSLWFFIRFFNQSRQARALQPQLQQAVFQTQNNRSALGGLLANCEEYAKTHPDLNRVLESFKTTPAPAAAPAARVPGK